MSLTKTFKHLLLEFQSKNYLYHFTSLDSASRIIDDNKIKASQSMSSSDFVRRKFSKEKPDEYKEKINSPDFYEGVSLTRNRRLMSIEKIFIGGMLGSMVGIGFVFDRNKLKNKYKLHTYDVHHHNPTRGDNYGGRGRGRRVLDEEIILDNVEPIRQLTEFLYLDKEYFKEQQDIEYVIYKLLNFYKSYHKYFEFKTFEGNFETVEIDNIEGWDSKTSDGDFQEGSPELQMYNQIFE